MSQQHEQGAVRLRCRGEQMHVSKLQFDVAVAGSTKVPPLHVSLTWPEALFTDPRFNMTTHFIKASHAVGASSPGRFGQLSMCHCHTATIASQLHLANSPIHTTHTPTSLRFINTLHAVGGWFTWKVWTAEHVSLPYCHHCISSSPGQKPCCTRAACSSCT